MATPYGDAVAADNPTVWWRFAESSGTAAADSGATGSYVGTHTGATAGAAALTDDENDAAVSYDGTDDYTLPFDASLDSVTGLDADIYPFSLECIIQTSSAAEMVAVSMMIATNNTRFREIGVSGGVAFALISTPTIVNTLSGGSGLDDGEKHHLAAVWVSATERYLYVDGVLVDGSNAEDSDGDINGFNNFRFGVGARLRNYVNQARSHYFSGVIDEAACYLQKALSAERVAAHAAAMTADTPDTFTATASLTASATELSATAEVTDPVYEATAALIASASTLSGAATFVVPTYSGEAALVAAASTLHAEATFDAPTFTGTADLTAAASVLTGEAEFDAPVFVGSAELIASAAVLDAIAILVTDVGPTGPGITVATHVHKPGSVAVRVGP